jgi:hypothetical protein
MRTLHLIDHRRLNVAGAACREQLRRNAEDLRNGTIGLFAPTPVLVGKLDQSCLHEHAHMEVQMARIDSESLGELTVRESPIAFRAEHLEYPDAQRVAERL